MHSAVAVGRVTFVVAVEKARERQNMNLNDSLLLLLTI